MFNPRQRFLAWAGVSLVGIWLVALAGHGYLESRKMTADKVHAFVESVPFGKLSGAARAQALKALEAKLNALTYEQRQRLRLEHLLNDWFAQMTEDEKGQFLEATLPSGFQQMITAFERLPEDKRRRVIDDALKHLRTGIDRGPNGKDAAKDGTNALPAISPELEAKVRTIGLKTFYSQSSAQTKAELAPLLEALQQEMESGRVILR